MIAELIEPIALPCLRYGGPVVESGPVSRHAVTLERQVLMRTSDFPPTAVELALPHGLAETTSGLFLAIDPEHHARGALICRPIAETGSATGAMIMTGVVVQRTRLMGHLTPSGDGGAQSQTQSIAVPWHQFARIAPRLISGCTDLLRAEALAVGAKELNEPRTIFRLPMARPASDALNTQLVQRILLSVMSGQRLRLTAKDCESEPEFLQAMAEVASVLPAPLRGVLTFSVGLSLPGSDIQIAWSAGASPTSSDLSTPHADEITADHIESWLSLLSSRARTAAHARGITLTSQWLHAEPASMRKGFGTALAAGRCLLALCSVNGEAKQQERQQADLFANKRILVPGELRKLAAEERLASKVIALRQADDGATDRLFRISLAVLSYARPADRVTVDWIVRRLTPRDGRATTALCGGSQDLATLHRALEAASSEDADDDARTAIVPLAQALTVAGRFALVERELRALAARLGNLDISQAFPQRSDIRPDRTPSAPRGLLALQAVDRSNRR